MENITADDVIHYFNGDHFGYVMVSSKFQGQKWAETDKTKHTFFSCNVFFNTDQFSTDTMDVGFNVCRHR